MDRWVDKRIHSIDKNKQRIKTLTLNKNNTENCHCIAVHCAAEIGRKGDTANFFKLGLDLTSLGTTLLYYERFWPIHLGRK